MSVLRSISIHLYMFILYKNIESTECTSNLQSALTHVDFFPFRFVMGMIIVSMIGCKRRILFFSLWIAHQPNCLYKEDFVIYIFLWPWWHCVFMLWIDESGSLQNAESSSKRQHCVTKTDYYENLNKENWHSVTFIAENIRSFKHGFTVL